MIFSSSLLGQAIHFKIPTPLNTPDPSGQLSTVSTSGSIDLSNSFFKSLGTNGRACVSCHIPSSGWTITPLEVQLRFLLSGGRDPIFRPVDGANCPSADVSSFQSRLSAYSSVLKKGLIRISLSVPSTAEFQITDVQDPYHCPETTINQPAMYRRPLPSTNLKFLSTVMWDGRETVKGQAINLDLATQAIDATLGHAEAAAAPTSEQVAEIVALETALFTAQSRSNSAGDLSAQGAQGGPGSLSTQSFFIGINDPLGLNPTNAPFDPAAFTIFDAWANLPGSNSTAAARRSVARGEMLFNTLPITITGVGGLNDLPGLATVKGTCTTCHDTPNAGDHSVSQPLDIGVTAYPAVSALDIAGLPVYTIQCNNTSPPTFVRTTDPGRALITGKCADIGKTKGPVLRGLAARAPYFHNGSAASLGTAVDFYNQRFALGLTSQQKADLVAFLNTL